MRWPSQHCKMFFLFYSSAPFFFLWGDVLSGQKQQIKKKANIVKKKTEICACPCIAIDQAFFFKKKKNVQFHFSFWLSMGLFIGIAMPFAPPSIFFRVFFFTASILYLFIRLQKNKEYRNLANRRRQNVASFMISFESDLCIERDEHTVSSNGIIL